MSKLFLAFTLLLPFAMKAQYPWTNLVTTFHDVYYPNDSTPHTLTLTLDTLYVQTVKNDDDYGIKTIVKTWYDNENKYGYGYVDEKGNPRGIWRYYIKTIARYEKFCQGSYIKLQPASLRMDEKMMRLLSAKEQAEQKDSYLQFAVPKWLFTGEWTFYNNGEVTKVIKLDSMLDMKFQEVIDDKGNITQVVVQGDPYGGKVRMSGGLVSSVLVDEKGKSK